MALSALARTALDSTARGGATYSGGQRTYDYANDPSTIRYKQFADEARAQGITDPAAIDKYATTRNQEWGYEHGIDYNRSYLERHPLAQLGLGAGIVAGGVYAAGGAAGGAAAGAGEGAAAAGEGAASVGGAAGAGEAATGASATGTAATGALDEGAMTQAARQQAIQSLASQGITSSGSAGAATGSALSRILDGSATTADWLSVGGNLGSTALGVAGSRNAANAYGNLADQYMQFGAPSRARYEASMTPGFDPSTIPGYSGAVDTASRGILARLAATGGNPWGNPGGLIEANRQIISGTALPAIEAYQRMNAGTGGYAGFNAAAPGMATNQIGAQGGVYNAVGSGLAGLLNPQPSLLETLRGLNVQGLN